MSKKLAIFYITEEWNTEKSVEELTEVYKRAIEGGLFKELVSDKIDGDSYDKLLEIMNSEKFAPVVTNFVTEIRSRTIRKTDLHSLKATEQLILMYFTTLTDKQRREKTEYMDVLTQLLMMSNIQIMYAAKLAKDRDLSTFRVSDIVPISECMQTHTPLNWNILMTVVDKIQ